ncbi:hypothetical protein CES85_0205 [Ochrobactrum quorumnocens]|uniref:Uncharacterized protein n=1 Tax=Ochrobactrum quorumnocens TaxID=271865 RepID=A0A248UF10_9HYPH|nr:hypothetical protein CES85_0205 [[Ochrobactrum] quorumnocens]
MSRKSGDGFSDLDMRKTRIERIALMVSLSLKAILLQQYGG